MNTVAAIIKGTVSWFFMRQVFPGGDFPWRLCYRAHRENLGHLVQRVEA